MIKFSIPSLLSHDFTVPIFINLDIILSEMGTIQSKIRDSYSIKQRPILKCYYKLDQRPLKLQLDQDNGINFQHKEQLQNQTSNKSVKEIDYLLHSQPQYPISVIGIIQYGTGCLISKNIVLTAASNLYHSELRQQAQNIKYYANYKAFKQALNLKIKFIYYPSQFCNNQAKQSEDVDFLDYGLITLEESQVLQNGHLGYNFTENNTKQDRKVFICGYERQSTKIAIKCKKITTSLNTYFCKNDDIGLNGAPVIEFKDNSYFVIGIYSIRQDKISFSRSILQLNLKIYENICIQFTQKEEEIDLRDKCLGKEGVKKLIKLNWNSLSVISLARNNIGMDGLKYLARCQWNYLYHLDIGGNDIKKEGVEHLVKISMKNIQNINLWGNNIGKEGVELLQSSNWAHLHTINLYNNSIGNEGLQILIKLKWPVLQSLNIGKDNITDKGIHLLYRSVWHNLVCLNLWGNSFKNTKLDGEIRKCFSKIKYIYL